MTKSNVIGSLVISLICLSSTLTGQQTDGKKNLPVKNDKPVVVVTKENLPQKIDSLVKPFKDSSSTYKFKIDSLLALKKIREEQAARIQKKNESKSKKVVYVDRVVTDTVYVKRESIFKKIANIFKSKKKRNEESKTSAD